MTAIQTAALALAILCVGYAYAGYPIALWLASRARAGSTTPPSAPEAEWPTVSITVPAYNEEQQIRSTLERLLQLDYPADRVQILVVSDASTDSTDAIVAEYAPRGVELLRIPARSGKTAAENAAQPLLRGEIILNTDAAIRLERGALKHLVRPFADPSVGVASGRDVSVGQETAGNGGEAGYVGYEMWVRELETRVGGIVGASGCCYAIRAHLHRTFLPEGLSRDFAAALVARREGYRAVSVAEAICYVPRTSALRAEYRRKVRTITRGLDTLAYMREMLDPFRYGWFALRLWSHKVLRWLVPWVLLASLGAIIAPLNTLGLVAAAGAALTGLAALGGFCWPESGRVPAPLAIPAFLLLGNAAALHASIRAMHGDRNAVWEPTRRPAAAS
jgi:cellulose synthase/poly-beta-1,6-N-acetylglucosamine synthase-like glycosyltransferase